VNIGILETGRPSPALESRFGRYDVMLARLLGERYRTRTYSIPAGPISGTAGGS
jgi:hypothetical protein